MTAFDAHNSIRLSPILAIIQMRKLRQSEVKQLAQDHPAYKGRAVVDPRSLAPWLMLIISILYSYKVSKLFTHTIYILLHLLFLLETVHS